MYDKNAAELQNATRKGVETYSTAEYAKALMPGWRVPLARLGYCRQDGVTVYKCAHDITFGVAMMAGVDMMVLPVVGHKKEFVVGTDLTQLLEAAGVTDAEYVDVWRTTVVEDAWQNESKTRAYRRVVGTVQRYYPAEERWDDAPRDTDRNIAVLARDVKRYGLNPQKIMADDAATKKTPSKGCEVARAARKRRAEQAINAKKPATWQGKDKGASSLLELDDHIFVGALAGAL